MKVFISYAREDINAALRIYNLVREIDGFDPWIDKFNLLPGSEWQLEIMRAIEDSQVVLLLLSNHSVTKTGFVQKEMREAIEKAKLFPPGQIVLIPMRLNDCTPMHSELKKLHWIDLFPSRKAGEGQLLKVLRELRAQARPGVLTHLMLLPSKREKPTIRSRKEFLKRVARSKNFSGYNLMYLDLSKLELSGFNFAGANLVGANLSRTNLNAANFHWANLERVQMNQADLMQAKFVCSNLWGANLKKARNLRHARLEDSNIFGVGISDDEILRLKQWKVFKASNYNKFFSHLSEALNLSPDDILSHCTWLSHSYFRVLFSDEYRMVFGRLAGLHDQLSQASGRFSALGNLLLDEPEESLVFIDVAYGPAEPAENQGKD